MRPVMRSATIRAVPHAMVQPMWPWPQLKTRFPCRPSPRNGCPAWLERERRGIALRGVDRQPHAGGTRDDRRADAEREHVGIRRQDAVARDDRVDPVAVSAELAHARAEPDGHAELLATDAREV